MKKSLKIGKAGHRTEADRMTENVGKKGTEARERNWRKLRGEFKEDLKGMKKFRKQFWAIKKGQGGPWGKTSGQMALLICVNSNKKISRLLWIHG